MSTKQLPLEFRSEFDEPTDQVPNSSMVLIIDGQSCPGSFLTTHFILKALKSKRSVILFHTHQTLAHWNGLLSKQGIQISSEPIRSIFRFINGYKFIYEGSSDQDFYEAVESEINQFCNHSTDLKPLVVIDDLTSFLWTTGDGSKILIALDRLQKKHKISLVVVFHSDRSSDPSDGALLRQTIRRSDLILTTRSLGSQSTGELKISRGPNDLSIRDSSNSPFDTILQYNIIDNSIVYNHKGLDRGFI